MMRPLAALALVVLLVAPANALAQPDPAAYPEEVKALLTGWMEGAHAMVTEEDRDQQWFAEAEAFLVKAETSAAEGRVRATMYELETFTELLLSGRLMDETRPLPSDAERKSRIIDRTNVWAADAEDAWSAYRQRLDSVEDDIASVRGMEMALYSAENALSTKLMTLDREGLLREFPKQPSFERGFVLALVRSSHTALLNYGWSEDLLSLVGRFEGVPPRLDADVWSNATAIALDDPGFGDDVPAHLQGYEQIGAPLRANEERVLSVALNLAEQRAARATGILVIFGDAQSRGLDVVKDASRGMRRQLNNTTVEDALDYGLLGVFTADAIDRATFTLPFIEQGHADLGMVVAAWSGLDHQEYVLSTLSAVSPVRPMEEDEEKVKTPVPAWAAWSALAAVAFILRRR